MTQHTITVEIDNDDPDEVAEYILLNCRSIDTVRVTTDFRLHHQPNPFLDTESPVFTLPPDESLSITDWIVRGDLRHSDGDVSNHEYTDLIKTRIGTLDVEFDSEYSCFYGYAKNEADARALATIVTQVHKEGPLA